MSQILRKIKKEVKRLSHTLGVKEPNVSPIEYRDRITDSLSRCIKAAEQLTNKRHELRQNLAIHPGDRKMYAQVNSLLELMLPDDEMRTLLIPKRYNTVLDGLYQIEVYAQYHLFAKELAERKRNQTPKKE